MNRATPRYRIATRRPAAIAAALLLVLIPIGAAIPMADGAAASDDGVATNDTAAADHVAATDDLAPVEVWLISTRRARYCGPAEPRSTRIDYWRLGEDRQWLRAEADDFFDLQTLDADTPPRPTTIFVHGNRTDRNGAIQNGWSVYRRLVRDAGEQRVRLVIWSWPSNRVYSRFRIDAQVKAARSDMQSYYLAECLNRLDDRTQVGLIGYSFGARVITGALHLLAGGHVAGQRLPTSQPDASEAGVSEAEPTEIPPRRAILVAAAMDADWLAPGHRAGRAMSQLEGLLVTRNACDPVLRWYPLMDRPRGSSAMGYVGPACVSADDRSKCRVVDVTCSIGRAHDWDRYLASPRIGGRLGWSAFLDPAPTTPSLTNGTSDR